MASQENWLVVTERLTEGEGDVRAVPPASNWGLFQWLTG